MISLELLIDGMVTQRLGLIAPITTFIDFYHAQFGDLCALCYVLNWLSYLIIHYGCAAILLLSLLTKVLAFLLEEKNFTHIASNPWYNISATVTKLNPMQSPIRPPMFEM